MKVSKFGCGLVATCFALSLGLAACKSDKKTPTSKDAAVATDSAVKADAGGGGTDSGTGTAAQCEATTEATTQTATGGKVTATCVTCVCAKAMPETLACNATCWGAIDCYARMCKDNADGTTNVGCAGTKCASFLTAITSAMTLGTKIKASCTNECKAPAVDGGTSNDAGGGNDAGHADAGN